MRRSEVAVQAVTVRGVVGAAGVVVVVVGLRVRRRRGVVGRVVALTSQVQLGLVRRGREVVEREVRGGEGGDAVHGSQDGRQVQAQPRDRRRRESLALRGRVGKRREALASGRADGHVED